MCNYFEARGVESSMYKDFKIPAYFQEVFDRLDPQARILDFGCGFGQMLYAIKKADISNGGGGNKSAKRAIFVWH